ncbi:MAG TPA: tetratricopeptide repeat protein [Thermoanaerobaculia bacterium]|nr:tetratricopeptide repeat protein [Thermoanaerobaculia bacterium]
MKRLLLIAATAALAACASMHHHDDNPYASPFYARYLNTGSRLDAQISQTVNALVANPRSASLHNQLGQMLLQKGFPKDAEVEFERAVNADSHFYPAWYNLGLVRMSRGDWSGSHFAFARTVHYKPGHSAALFQLGLMEENRHHQDAAIDYYAKAFTINHSLLDVRVNPRILDSKLTDLALLKAYPTAHARESMAFQSTPPGYVQQGLEAPSTQPAAKDIVTPALPVTDPSMQAPPPTPGTPVQPAPQPAKPPGSGSVD